MTNKYKLLNLLSMFFGLFLLFEQGLLLGLNIHDLKAGDRKEYVIDNVSFAVRYIPPGRYMRGSPANEKGRWNRETLHQVTISRGFWMMETEVTQALYEAVMLENKSRFIHPANPAENVTWKEAVEFCRRLSDLTGLTWTLPTEAEWEYACRAGTTTIFHYGNSIGSDQANFNGRHPYGDASRGVNRRTTLPVGSFAPNAWGLYDMHGNVWEWCLDLFGDYPNHQVVDPQGPPRGSGRIFRGGSWACHGEELRSANWCIRAEVRGDDIGFRAVMRPSQ